MYEFIDRNPILLKSCIFNDINDTDVTWPKVRILLWKRTFLITQ